MTESALPPVPDETDKWVLRAFAIVTWLWFLVSLPVFNDVAPSFCAWFILVPAWVILFIFWLSLGIQGGPLSPLILGIQDSPASKRWWRIAGVAVALGPFLSLTNTGLVVRVALSRPWLDAYADQVPPSTHDTLHEARLVGLFLVDGTEETEGAVFLYVRGGWLNRHGLVRVPTGQAPPHSRVHAGQRLLGPWYTFWWKF